LVLSKHMKPLERPQKIKGRETHAQRVLLW